MACHEATAAAAGCIGPAPGASPADFVRLAYANGPAATLSVDVTVLYVLANFWIVHEGRRRGMRHLWAYVLCNTFVAVAFGLGLFLWRREQAPPQT